MILGVQTLRNFGVMLKFAECTITIDHREILIRPLDAFSNVSIRRYILKRGNYDTHRNTIFPGAPLAPVSVAEATYRTMGIIEESYGNADLPKVICEICSYLTALVLIVTVSSKGGAKNKGSASSA